MEDIFADIDYYDDLFAGVDSLRLAKQYIRDADNPFECRDFQKKYRFSQDSVFYITSLLRNKIEKPDKRGLPIAPEISVLLTLRFFATSSFKQVCEDIQGISQPTASNVITRMSAAIANLGAGCVKFPIDPQAINNNRQLFEQIGQQEQWPGLPNIDGVLDCTHVKILKTPNAHYTEDYRNRNKDFSINVQAVVGPRMEFLDVDAKWPGSTADFKIFQESTVYTKYREGKLTGSLVSDIGYPSLPFLLTPVTPILNIELDLPSQNYNSTHTRTWNIVQQTFSMWKRRFPCLTKGMGNKLSTISNIIEACAVLHNLAIMLGDSIEYDKDEDVELENDLLGDRDFEGIIPNSVAGLTVRQGLIDSLFT